MLFSQTDATFLTEVQAILPASKAIDREKLWPFIEQAERKYIKPLLEDELFTDLDKFYNNQPAWSGGSGEDSTRTTELLRLIRIAELNLAFFIGFPVLNTVISTTGFQKVGDGENFSGLYKYQETDLKRYFEETGYNGLDDMLKYIEDNIEYFPEWEESSIYAARKTAIIKDAATFDAICDIGKSRIIFLRLQRFMNEVIDFEIKPLLGDEYATLISELARKDPAAKYAALAVEVQKPLAYLACAKLIEKTGNLTARGLFFEGKNSMNPDDSFKRPASNDEALTAMASYNRIGCKYLELLRQYLIDNLFTEQGSENGSPFDRDNTDKKTFWT